MAKMFRVAVLGKENMETCTRCSVNNSLIIYAGSHKAEYYNSYGLQVFDLAVDQICNLLEKPDPENGQYGDYSSLASVYTCRR